MERALFERASFKEHILEQFSKVPMSKIWESLVLDVVHPSWVNVWHVFALLRTYCPVEAAVVQSISLRGRFTTTSMHDMVETHVLSMCMALHSNPPSLREWAQHQGVQVARHLVAWVCFDVHPRKSVSKHVDACTKLEQAMLECLTATETMADDGDVLPMFGGEERPLGSAAPAVRHGDGETAEAMWLQQQMIPPMSNAGNHDFFTFCKGMQSLVAACSRATLLKHRIACKMFP